MDPVAGRLIISARAAAEMNTKNTSTVNTFFGTFINPLGNNIIPFPNR
jgi:hypothetical protein